MTEASPARFPDCKPDLRWMLYHHLLRRARSEITAAAERRAAAIVDPSVLSAWRNDVRTRVRRLLKLEGLSALPLNATVVSRHERRDYVLENVLFDSIEGWWVNASLFIPQPPRTPGAGSQSPARFPAVVVPCGHGPKSQNDHQLPCQVFARAGMIALTFDAPAPWSEKPEGNDHFTDGPRCHAVGLTPQRYFVADALRAMDYLASRPDVAADAGFAMTGVSGGGHTTQLATLLDDRVALAAPVCCAAPLLMHPLGNLYAICSEQLFMGRLALGLDDADLMAAAAPVPQLYMAGLRDEVFTAEMTRELMPRIAAVYAGCGAANRFAWHLEDVGHSYTPAMAKRFVEFARRHWLNSREPWPFHLESLTPEPAEAMRCGPPPEPNLRSSSVERAKSLRANRRRLADRADANAAVRAIIPGIAETRIDHVQRGRRDPIWHCDAEELVLHHETDIALPAVALWPKRAQPWPAVLIFDDHGRWNLLRQAGVGAVISRHLDDGAIAAPAVLSVDLRGWGDTAPAASPYELASWSAPDRWPAFVSASLSDGLLGQRVRDGVAAAHWLTHLPGIDPHRLVVIGRGIGGIVALLAAAVIEHVAGVVAIDTPTSIEEIVACAKSPWPADIFQPHILEHLDLDALAEAVAPVLWVRPRHAADHVMRDDPDTMVADWVWRRLSI